MARAKKKWDEASFNSWVRHHEKFLKTIKAVEEKGFDAMGILRDCADGKLQNFEYYRRRKEGAA